MQDTPSIGRRRNELNPDIHNAGLKLVQVKHNPNGADNVVLIHA
jgi:hypothetical protein